MRNDKHTACISVDSLYSTLSVHFRLQWSPKLMMLKCVPWLGSARNSMTRAFFAVEILPPDMLPLRSTKKMYSWDGIGGSLTCGATVSCKAIVPSAPLSAKQRAASNPSALIDNTKS